MSLSPSSSLVAALSIRDLSDRSAGPHAMQLVLDELVAALAAWSGAEVRLHRALPIVSTRHNYDRLYYPPDGVAREARYTRWLGADVLLRTQTSAMIPSLLDGLAAEPDWTDVMLVCPGLVYRRDQIDRHHVGEPHQVDVWRIRRGGGVLDGSDLRAMIDTVVAAALPAHAHRVIPARHPYTVDGLQIDALDGGAPIEIGECGRAAPAVLADAGLDPLAVSGLAMGLGLDRLLMLRKGLDDIRLLRATDPRIAPQMLDLAPWQPVSMMPAAWRDLSIAADAADTVEDLGDRVRAALGPDAATVESVTILAATPYEALPPAARTRLAMSLGEQNLLVRVVLRDLARTLTTHEANALRDRIYAALTSRESRPRRRSRSSRRAS
jgi:phenylalanyl-tRNA synthetase alpha chain